MWKMILLCLLMLVPAGYVLAVPHEECSESKDCASCHRMTVEEAKALLKEVGEVKSVKLSRVQGLFEVTVENKGQQAVAHVDFKKQHLLAGPIFDLVTKKATPQQPKVSSQAATKVDITAIPLDNSIIMGNPEGKKRIFVFTDPECPYCAKLHRELVKLIYMEPDLGIFVKMYPLKMHPHAFDKARVVLGQKSVYLLDQAFAGEQLPAPGPGDKAKPVEDTINLAESLGIFGTPAIVLQDGSIVPGYVEAAKLKELVSRF